MKASRHNGRSGKHGSYNPKHNDRQFDPTHSEHIDQEKMLQNIYWDCYNGHRTQAESMKREYPSFEEVELRFYEEQYTDFVIGQNARNEKNRHTERNRSINQIYQDKKTCPEESILQLGNIDGSVSPDVLLGITSEFLKRFEDAYGEHIHIIDWALHVDEKTPHIHERHVFDAPNNYGEIAPQQDKALELLGFELPEPGKAKSRSNNRKRVFDAQVRNMFLDICEEYEIAVEREASYGGRVYMEKQDFIIANQKQRLINTKEEIKDTEETLSELSIELAEKNAALELADKELKAVDVVFESLAEAVYEEACDIIITEAVAESIDSAVANANQFREDNYLKKECYYSSEVSLVKRIMGKAIDRVKEKAGAIIEWLQFTFMEPEKKTQNVEKIKTKMMHRLDQVALGKKVDDDEEVNKKAREVAETLVRRRRGR